MNSGDSKIGCTSPHVQEETKNFTLNDALSDKSQKMYQREYQLFVEWCDVNKAGLFYSENVLVAYVTEISKTKKSSTMWSVYSMLKKTLAAKHNVDISKYNRLIAFLKKLSTDYRPTRSKILNRDEIKKFLLHAPDENYLMLKVALVFGICGACRCEELTNMMIDDINDTGTIIMVKIPNTKPDGVQRTFIVSNGAGQKIDYLSFYRKYVALRPSHLTTKRFFLKYTNGKCANQVVGKNTIGIIPKRIAEYLKLPDPALYTRKCFPRSSATLLAGTEEQEQSCSF